MTYRVTTLVIDETGQLAYATSCPVHLWLPPRFPDNAPVLRPMVATFHPNVAMEWVHLSPPWRPDASLVDVVTNVGFLLAYRTYDPAAVANPVAMSWALTNAHLLPTDVAADFSPAAGGGPTERIARFGPETLRPLRESLELASERLVSADPAARAEGLERLALEADATLPLFLDPDLPDHLRDSARELAAMAESLRGPDPVWSGLGRQFVASRAVAVAAADVVRAEESLRRLLAAAVTRPATAPGTAEPAEPPGRRAGAASAIPPVPVVQQAAVTLRNAVREAEQAIVNLRERLAQFAAAPTSRKAAAAAPHNSLLSRRLALEVSRLSEAMEPARASGASLASLEPVLDLATREAAAAERLVAWAEHRDALRRGGELAARLRTANPATIQACHVENAAGRTGPFEFEQRIDPGDGGPPLAVWNLRAGLVRVVDAETEAVVARGDGRVVVPRPGGTLSILVGDDAHGLRVRIEQLISRSGDALSRLRPPDNETVAPSALTTWAARLARDLDAPDAQAQAEEEHRRAVDEWTQLLADLSALGRFKNRLATYHLLGRLAEFIPRAKADREQELAAMARADALLAEIGARSAGDINSDRLIIPLHFAADYATHMAERDRAGRRIERLGIAVDGTAERLRLQLAKPRLLGSAELPHLRVLPPLPATYAEQQRLVSDDALRVLVRRLEELLGTTLPVGPAVADAAESVEAVAPPAPADARGRDATAGESQPSS